MRKYLYLQLKRILRYLPGAACVVLVLLGGLLAAFSLMVGQNAQSEENQKFKIGLAGETDDSFLQMGLTALESFDSSRFAMEIVQMEESQAADALSRGEIAAYVVIPEGFVQEAMRGENMTMKFVSTTGATGMVSIMKEEITKVISALMVETQKGYFGLADGLRDQEAEQIWGPADRLMIHYAEHILVRDHIYRLDEMGISDQLGMEGYLLCGLSVLLMMLSCLPFAPLMIRPDPALGRMLAAKGKSPFGQTVCDFAAYALGVTALVLLVLAVACATAPNALTAADMAELLPQALPVVILTAAFSFMLYALSADLISGVLLQFFVTVAVCFVSGCMYPVYFFPEAVQKMAAWLPAGVARAQLAGYMTGSTSAASAAILWGYSGAFFAVGALARICSIRRKQG